MHVLMLNCCVPIKKKNNNNSISKNEISIHKLQFTKL